MYAYIKGMLIHATPSAVILETGGIGYKIFIPANLLNRLPQLEQETLLHTSFVIRENAQTLYGFLTVQERDLFEVLQNVTGVGPKLALSLTGHLNLTELHRAVSNHDVGTFAKVPGVGKKIAERLILEMRGKLDSLFPQDVHELATSLSLDPKAQCIHDAMGALINLGYNQNSAQKAIKKTLSELPESTDLGTLITMALKNIH